MNHPSLVAACLATAVLGGCQAETLVPATADRSPAGGQSMYVAPARCVPPKITDARDLLPNGLSMAAQVDLTSLSRGVFGPEMEAAMKSTPSGREMVAALGKCGLPGTGIDKLTIAAESEDEMAVVLEGPGLGSDKTLDCVHDAIEASSGNSPWIRRTAACTTSLELDGGDGTAYVAGPNMVVLATKGTDKKVKERLAGRGVAALDGHLKWARKEVDFSRTFWVAMDVPAALASGAAGLSRVAGSVDAAKGLDVQMSAVFGSRTEAEEAAGKLQMVTSMGPMLGLPTSLMDSIKVDQTGDTIAVEVFVSPSDLETLREIAKGTP